MCNIQGETLGSKGSCVHLCARTHLCVCVHGEGEEEWLLVGNLFRVGFRQWAAGGGPAGPGGRSLNGRPRVPCFCICWKRPVLDRLGRRNY